MTSSGSDLRNRIRQQEEAAKRQIEETTQRELKSFGEQLNRIVSSELSTIESATTGVTERVVGKLSEFETTAATKFEEDERGFAAASTSLTAKAAGLLLRRWAGSVATGLMICLGIFGGSWGMTQWLSAEIRSDLDLLGYLESETNRILLTRQRLEDETWGVTLEELSNGRFVVLPPGTALCRPADVMFRAPRPWTVRGLPAVRLSSE